MAVLSVGAGQQYQTIAAAIAAAQDGDTVAIQAGTYVNDFAEVTKKITIEGVGGMAKLVATGSIPNGKAILVTDTDVTVDHLEFSGATVADGNGAGIRYQGGNLTIANSYFHDNQEGLLAAANPTGSIAIANSEFADNGAGDGYTHNLYVSDIAALTITDSYFHGAVVGHEIKSRAQSTTVTGTRIQDEPGGTASYSIDLPNGGNALISNDVIEQSAATQNPNIIAFGEEGNVYAGSSLVLSNSTVLNDLASPSANLLWNASADPVVISNITTWGLTTGQLLRGPGTVAGITALAAEPALDTSSPQATPTVTSPAPAPITLPNGELPVFRFFDSVSGTQFLTSSTSERADILATRPDLQNEGMAFAAVDPTAQNAAPVFRFFDTTNGTHFFTASASERDAVAATRPDLAYEGVAFDDDATQLPGTVPVFRFFDTGTGTHLFTDSAVERASILATRPDLVAEGIAFYAPSTS